MQVTRWWCQCCAGVAWAGPVRDIELGDALSTWSQPVVERSQPSGGAGGEGDKARIGVACFWSHIHTYLVHFYFLAGGVD